MSDTNLTTSEQKALERWRKLEAKRHDKMAENFTEKAVEAWREQENPKAPFKLRGNHIVVPTTSEAGSVKLLVWHGPKLVATVVATS